METIIQVYIPATVAVIMLAMGLGLVVDDFRRVASEPKAVAIGVIAQLLFLPALGFLFAHLFGLQTELAVGLVLVAACPGGPSSNLFTYLARGDVALSVTLTAISGFVTMATIPLIANLAMTVFAGNAATDTELVLPVGETIFRIFVVVGVPLVIGMIIRVRRPGLAARVEKIAMRIAVVMMTLLIIGAVFDVRDQIVEIFTAAAAPTMLLNLTGMVTGFVVAVSFGLPDRQVISIPFEVGTQNAALAIGIAIGLMDNELVGFPGAVYGLFMYLTCGIWVVISRRRLARVEARQAASES